MRQRVPTLKREGYRTYVFTTADGRWFAIDRDAPRRFYVRPYDWPRRGFFAQQFRRLRDAVSYLSDAPQFADNWPDPAMPKFLRRYRPEAWG